MSYSVFAIRKSPADALAAIKQDEGYAAVPQNVKAELEGMLKHYLDAGVECLDVQCHGQEPHLASYDAGFGGNSHIVVTVQHREQPKVPGGAPPVNRKERRAKAKKKARA